MAFTQVFGGNTIYPTDYSYQALTLDGDVTFEWPLDAATGALVLTAIVDVATEGIYAITMPDATLASPGQVVMFNNLGPDTFTVLDADGGGLLSVLPGTVWQIYLTSNAAAAGRWRSFQSGASTAQAQAAALAGAGLVAIGALLAQASDVTVFTTSPQTLVDADRAEVFVWEGALGTLNLPSSSAVGNGWFINVRNGGTGDWTIDPAGSEIINGDTTLRLSPGDSAVITTDGTGWWTIGLGQQAVFAFDYTTVSLNGLTGDYTLSGSELNRIVYKFTGVLAGDVEVIVPATVQQYWFNNATTGGSYTVSIKAAGSGTIIGVPRNQRGIYYCDGTEVIKADTTSGVPVPLSIAEGGTGATSAPNARTNLGVAASGANSDITSLAGLTTPLSIAQGGTSAATASAARTALGSTAVGDAVFTAANAAAGRTALSAAQSGTNTDITTLNPSGGLQTGAPTGGAQGTGTINATGLFINGVAVGVGSGSVSSVNASGGTTGLTFSGGPVTTSGTLTMAGTLAVANGGTGLTATPTNGQIDIGNGTGFTRAAITAGAGISVTNGAGSITIAASGGGTGTVTSVDASGGSTGLTFSGGPITTSGTLTAGGTLNIAYGGTGATTASGARAALNAAIAGTNTDITRMTGLDAGTVSAPSVTFFTDSNTGIYLPSADDLAVSAGGTRVFDFGTTNVQANVLLTAVLGIKISTGLAPATSSSTGQAGQIAWDTSFLYCCTATNTWKRVALSTF